MPTFFIVMFFFILFCYSPAMAFVIGICALIYCFGVKNSSAPQKSSEEEKPYETYAEKQERTIKHYIRPDFDPDDPELKEFTKETQAKIDRRRKEAEARMQMEELSEQK